MTEIDWEEFDRITALQYEEYYVKKRHNLLSNIDDILVIIVSGSKGDELRCFYIFDQLSKSCLGGSVNDVLH